MARVLPCALLFVPVWAAAQAPAYRRAPGDTLRYHEVTSGTVEVRPATGPVTVRTSQDARIGLTFAHADTARAWYEALALRTEGMGPDRRPDTAPLIGRPYTLRLSAGGRVETLATPELPAEVRAISDLSAQFADFFPRLPDGPLTPGTIWADTASHETTDPAGRTVVAQRFGSYRVRGDSTVRGEPVVVVEVRTESEIVTGSATPRASGATVQTTQEGEETGVFLFATASGRLVERRRTGRLSGSIVITSGSQQISIPQSYTYESRIELIR